MTRRRHAPRRPSRRSLLHNGLAAVAALAFPNLATAGDEGFVQQFGKVEPENYPWGWIRWLLNGQIDPKAEITLGLVEMEAEPGEHAARPPELGRGASRHFRVARASRRQALGHTQGGRYPADSQRACGTRDARRRGSRPCLYTTLPDGSWCQCRNASSEPPVVRIPPSPSRRG